MCLQNLKFKYFEGKLIMFIQFKGIEFCSPFAFV